MPGLVESETKDDSYNLIQPTQYTLLDVWNYVKGTHWAGNCQFLEALLQDEEKPYIKAVEEVCAKFSSLVGSEQACSIEDFRVAMTAISIIFYIDFNPWTFDAREALLDVLFSRLDTLNPLHVHLYTKSIWDNLRLNGDNKYVFNIINLCTHIAARSTLGQAVALSLSWAILGEMTEKRTPTFRFRKFSELPEIMQEIDDDVLSKPQSLPIVYLLVKSLGFLMEQIGSIEADHPFMLNGYRSYFEVSRGNIKSLKEWLQHLRATLASSENDSVLHIHILYFLRSVINELDEMKTT